MTSHAASLSTRSTVLLGTALVKITSSSGTISQAKALIDPGSQICYATESLMKRLRVQRSTEAIPITGVGGNKSYSNGSTDVTVSSLVDERSVIEVQVFILSMLTSYTPKCSKVVTLWSYIVILPLADPYFYSNTAIDYILGIDAYHLIVRNGTEIDPVGTPVAQNTSLRWILMCSSNQNKTSVFRTSHQIFQATNLVSLVETMKQFWDLESVLAPAPSVMLSSEEAQCEEHFLNTFSRDKTGRFMVRFS